MRHDTEIKIPMHILYQAIMEVPESVLVVIANSAVLYSQKRMLASDFDSYLRSVAWQSTTLKTYYEDLSMFDEENEILSEEDLLFLAQG